MFPERDSIRINRGESNLKSLNLHIVKFAGIALLGALAISLGVGERAVHAQTLFGLAHSGSNGPSTLYTIDTNTGEATEVGPTGFERCSGMDFNTSGTLFATCERANPSQTHVLIIIDTGSGVGAEVRPTGVDSSSLVVNTASDISFNADDVLFAHLVPLNSLWTMSVTSGVIKFVGSTLLTGSGNGIAFSEDELFHADGTTLNTLNLDPLMPLGEGILEHALDFQVPAGLDCCGQPRINAMDFQPGTEDEILFASVNDRLFKDPAVLARPLKNFLATIDTATGVVSIIDQTVDGLDAIAFAPAAAAPLQAELGALKCYDAKRPRGTPDYEEVEVSLEDEFEPYPEITRVTKPERFCTPVSKDGAEIPYPTAYFTCYKIKDVKEEQPKFERQDVGVKNQFGDLQALTLKKSKLLCVPSTIVQ
jgi:hypothetical protein